MKKRISVDERLFPVEIATAQDEPIRLDIYKRARLLHDLTLIAGHKGDFRDAYDRSKAHVLYQSPEKR